MPTLWAWVQAHVRDDGTRTYIINGFHTENLPPQSPVIWWMVFLGLVLLVSFITVSIIRQGVADTEKEERKQAKRKRREELEQLGREYELKKQKRKHKGDTQ
jgi:hypothetical protein